MELSTMNRFLLLFFVLKQAYSLKCLKCNNGTSETLCTNPAIAVYEDCTQRNDVCFSRTWPIPQTNDIYLTEKGCMSNQGCEALVNQNDDACARGEVRGVCTFCCQLDKCNEGRTGSLEEECPGEVAAFRQCMARAISTIVNTTTSKEATCRLLKTDLDSLAECRKEAAKTCKHQMDKYLAIGNEFVQRAVDRVCEVVPDAEVPVLFARLQAIQEPTKKPCDIARANFCFNQLEIELQKNMGQNELILICKNLLPPAIKCAEEISKNCDKNDQQKIMNLITLFRDDKCHMNPCKLDEAAVCLNEAKDRVDKGKIKAACMFRGTDEQCVLKAVKECTDKEKALILLKLQDYLDSIKDQCKELFVECQGQDRVITLTEGGPSRKIDFTVRGDPTYICGGQPNCQVFLDFVPEDVQNKRCPSTGKPEPGILIGDTEDDKYQAVPFIEITDKNWQNPHMVRLLAKLDFIQGPSRRRNFHIYLRKVVNGVIDVDESGNVCSYQVVINNNDKGKVCHSLNDPHLKTFDGARYDCHMDGFFYLYRHNTLPYEVQARYGPCSRRHPHIKCNCGVYIRSYNSVYVMNGCNRQSYENYIACTSNDVKDLQVFTSADGKTIDVILPHGQRIRIILFPSTRLMNLYVHSSPYDLYETDGLCGIYDGSTQNENHHLCNEFKVPQADQLDNVNVAGIGSGGRIPKVCLPVKTNTPARDQVCDADGSFLYDLCHLKLGREKTKDIRKVIVQQRGRRGDARTRRQAVSGNNNAVGSLAYSKWTEAEAREMCIEFLLEQEMVQNCVRLPKLDAMSSVENCVLDLRYTNSTDWLMVARDDVFNQCDTEIKTRSTFLDGGAGHQIAMQLVQISMCPGNCSDNGLCDEGVCHCHANFYGVDCSMQRGAPPAGITMYDSGLCDASKTDCSVVIVDGDHFIQTDTLKCQLTPIKVLDSDVTTPSDPVLVEGTVLNIGQVACTPPQIYHSYSVKVTLDGNAFSPDVYFVPYNSICHTCKTQVGSVGDAVCTRRENNCVVDRECFAAGDVSPDDSNYVCSPKDSISEFTRKSGCGGPPSNNLGLIIVLCVATLATVI